MQEPPCSRTVNGWRLNTHTSLTKVQWKTKYAFGKPEDLLELQPIMCFFLFDISTSMTAPVYHDEQATMFVEISVMHATLITNPHKYCSTF
jgi:hypothetical protein